ncbi:RNA polymerase sigma24 factor [Dactylosporangium sucinum]|uniref:RNA polymerase sigma24 factor n=1 Tax=Dactylosporangium sucinum TaxID=1424081 RepID=A0A917WWP7_9ACTN|nr:RNA polymerase sigma24 factor [Dactylosporangium sucinum]
MPATFPYRDHTPPRPGWSTATAADPRDPDQEAALALLFELHYADLLRLAALLGADDAENIVAEAYYQLYRRWHCLRGSDAAPAYLRSIVCNLTRMRLRHLYVARKHTDRGTDPVAVASAESIALVRDDQRILMDALGELSARQRQVLVLRHWLGLREAEIATAMGISVGAVKSHGARAIAALTKVMEDRR